MAELLDVLGLLALLCDFRERERRASRLEDLAERLRLAVLSGSSLSEDLAAPLELGWPCCLGAGCICMFELLELVFWLYLFL